MQKKMNEMLNEQMNKELESYYFYLALSGYFFQENWDGFGMWMLKQAEEEKEHAMKIYRHIIERQGTVTFNGIPKPTVSVKSPLDAFEQVYTHEQKITASIHQIMKAAQAENDYPTVVLMNWFVEEQMEEENTVDGIVQKLKKIGDSVQGLMFMDAKLGERS